MLRPKVLHVVDRITGGVPLAVINYISNGPAEYEHSILSPFANHQPSAVWEGLDATHHDLGDGLFHRIRQVRRVAATMSADVIHAHSSFAGAYTRLALSRNRVAIIYTPHCFSFMRQDISAGTRMAFRWLEGLLGWNTTILAACSPGERMIADSMPSLRGRAAMVPNVSILDKDSGLADTALPSIRRVGMTGRVCAQKDPNYFLRVVERLQGVAPVKGVWIGDGDPSLMAALSSAGVAVTGWLTGEELASELRSLDLYVHSAAWEGFPLSVLDAAATATPMLVRPIEAFGDLDSALDSEAGLDALLAAIASGDLAEWRLANLRGWADYLRLNTRANQCRMLGRVWGDRSLGDS